MTPFVDFETLVRVTGGEILVPTDRAGSGASIDTRSLVPGAVFFALKGEKVHGHQFVDRAAALGAAAVVLDRSTGELPDLTALRRIGYIGAVAVDDPRIALWNLARARRDEFEGVVVAVCGSNGKTTTKDIAGSICRAAGPSLATQGSFNNDLGVPLTILRLEPYHHYAVLELGMNHFGEIDRLAGLARPRGAVITNIGPEHLEGLGSIEGVAKAEGEVIAHLPPDGFFVVNADDPHCVRLGESYRGRRVTFGLDAKSDVSASEHRITGDGHQSFVLHYGPDRAKVTLPLVGQHNLLNALAASGLALGLEIPVEAVIRGLEAAEPAVMRGRLVTARDNIRILVDCYNANPASMEAALRALDTMPGPGRKIAVLGEMRELGPESDQLHMGIGKLAGSLGFDVVYAWGPGGKCIADGARGGNVPLVVPCQTHGEILDALLKDLRSGDRIVVKGSRGSTMEKVAGPLVESLTGQLQGGAH